MMKESVESKQIRNLLSKRGFTMPIFINAKSTVDLKCWGQISTILGTAQSLLVESILTKEIIQVISDEINCDLICLLDICNTKGTLTLYNSIEYIKESLNDILDLSIELELFEMTNNVKMCMDNLILINDI